MYKYYIFLLFIYCSIYQIQSNGLFDSKKTYQLIFLSIYVYFVVQDTLTILCTQFPFISTINDSSLQCARLRIDENIPSSDFNLDNPSEIILFIIVNQSSNISPVNIIINFSQSSNSLSSINEIYIALLVVDSNFTINNETTSIYLSYDIPILHWSSLQPDTYNLTDLLHLNSYDYVTDKSMCQWNIDRWNRILNGNSSYAYFLKTTNTNLIFTLTDPMKTSPPSPYLNILYCVPYQLGKTELIILIFSAILVFLFFLIFSILHYYKGNVNRLRYVQKQVPDRDRTYTNTAMESIEDNDNFSEN